MKKIIKFLAYVLVVFFLISLYSSVVFKVGKGGSAGPFTKPIKYISKFPSLIERTFTETVKERKTLKAVDPEFEAINNLDYDLWILRSFITDGGGRKVVLHNLRNDSIERSWELKKTYKNHLRILNPLMMPNGDLIYNFNSKSGLKRIDSEGNFVWQANKNIVAHHSLNLDHEGNVWGCAIRKEKKKVKTLSFQAFEDEKPVKYRDDLIVKWDASSGKILYKKSLTEIMLEKNLINELFQKASSPTDPFHLNDVQPILADTGYFQQGDLLVSIKNSHTILHYRPANDSIVRFIQGPFAYQHDVDIINGHTISIFNNNMFSGYNRPIGKPFMFNKEDSLVFEMESSNVLLYDYNTGKFASLFEEIFIENSISTKTEGLSTILPNGDMLIEEQNEGILWVVNGKEVVYKNVFESFSKGFKDHLNWTRVIEKQ